ncbi:MAG: four helix bundle protein [Balneolaceae bacterium]|nr:four helix bundle protein [Balneolaceae bacterium]
MPSNISFSEAFKNRTKQFAVNIVKLCRRLPKTREADIFNHQLIRCSSSVASNYRAACRARSAKEFYAKLCIVVEEADECIFWLEMLEATNAHRTGVEDLIKEGTEILSIAATSRKTTGKRLE